MSDEDLPVNKVVYVKLVSLCVSYGCFTFNNEEDVEHRGLQMGSSLSAVMFSLYMESLEKDRFLRVMGRGTSWFRYVDDVLAIVPERTIVSNKLSMLNEVNQHIKFTVEEEADGALPFLDTIIHRSDNGIKFSVYRKPTNNDDNVHYLSNHDLRTKSGVVIGFFLRAYRICSEEYLGYPMGLLGRLKKKAELISKRNSAKKEGKKECIVVPYSKKAETITRFLTKMGVDIVHASGKKIRDVVVDSPKVQTNENSAVVRDTMWWLRKEILRRNI